jgi:hypothetical protein
METLRIIKSVFAAMIGVQKRQNLEADFAKNNATPFIIAGIIMTLVFIISVWLVVQLALKVS